MHGFGSPALRCGLHSGLVTWGLLTARSPSSGISSYSRTRGAQGQGDEREAEGGEDETNEEGWNEKAEDDELIKEFMSMNEGEGELGAEFGGSGVGRESSGGKPDDASSLLKLGAALVLLASCDVCTLGDQVGFSTSRGLRVLG